MFTGLVQAQGIVVSAMGGDDGITLQSLARAAGSRAPRRLHIATRLHDDDVADAGRRMQLGDSVAIDGCCLTVVHIERGHLSFEAASETLRRTTIGLLRPGDHVNLEAALRVGDRLGGHLVLGHVDAVGEVREMAQRGSAVYMAIAAPAEVARLVAPRGSVTVAGVSLTAVDASSDAFACALIPHTLHHTGLGRLKTGAKVNLEADTLARYVERLLRYVPLGGAPSPSRTTPGHA